MKENEQRKNENKNESKNKDFLQAVKFLLFSVSAGAIQLLSDTLMLEVFGFQAWLSYLIALVLSVLWNFTLNRKFTFHSAKNVPIAMLKVAGYYLVFTPLSTLWTKYLTESLLWNEYVVLVITMVVNFVTEFLFQKFVVFNDKDNKKHETNAPSGDEVCQNNVDNDNAEH